MSTSIVVAGMRARTAAIVAANPAAPPSAHVVARDARDHRVLEPERRDRVRDARRLVRVDGQRLAGVDEAEPARTRAAVTEDHERRGAVGPALVDVRAAGFLAHRVQLEPPHQPLRLPEPHPQIRLHPHPRRPLHPRLPVLASVRPAVEVGYRRQNGGWGCETAKRAGDVAWTSISS